MFDDDELLDLEDSVFPTFSLLDILDFYDPMEVE